jgi:hypothetical protein
MFSISLIFFILFVVCGPRSTPLCQPLCFTRKKGLQKAPQKEPFFFIIIEFSAFFIYDFFTLRGATEHPSSIRFFSQYHSWVIMTFLPRTRFFPVRALSTIFPHHARFSVLDRFSYSVDNPAGYFFLGVSMARISKKSQ